jgi:aminomethyltransferase
MPEPTPFHPRTSELCQSLAWRHWAGYHAVSNYRDFLQPEYAAIRHSAALIDVSPLYKYRVEGPQAAAFLDRVITHHAAGAAVGQAIYTPWCDADGKVRQEGTVFRLAEDRFQVNAAEPAYGWLLQNAAGFDVELADDSTRYAALSLQGPHARRILRDVTRGVDLDDLKFFRLSEGEIAGARVLVSRTGYTGDLGYELWLERDAALAVWDALIAGGEPHHVRPCGLAAMDVARVEAGFILVSVDYKSSEAALVEADKSTPYELGMGWAVKLGKGPFVGRRALMEEKAKGSAWQLVGLEIGWEPLEKMFIEVGLMPDLPHVVNREPVPVYAGLTGPQVGQVTSRVWSSLLKKYVALASVETRYASPGSELAMEVTVRYSRRRAPARVVKTPFFRPERMRA